ncbi:MAG TPA: ABC transporter permease [Vicinamibacterales bacterium]|nr:ABC transporter permease [Vicinamibacterales bacterium]
MHLIFRLLVTLFPHAFRERYGVEMLLALVDRRRDARRGGRWMLVKCDLGAAADLLKSAAAEAVRSARSAFMSIGQDVRFAIRMLWRRPALSAFSAATLALGIGAVTAVWSIVYAVLLQPLPYPRSHEIVALRGIVNGSTAGVSYRNILDIRERVTTMTALSPFFAQSVNLTGVLEPDRLRGGFVTSEFFRVVDVQPVIGTTFGSDADVAHGPRLAVLTYDTWRNRFGQRLDIIGLPVQLNNATFSVAGVMPASFDFPIDDVEVLLPFWTTTAGIDRANHNYIAVGRLTPAATPAQATLEAASIAAALERVYPEANAGRSARVEPLKDVLVEDTRYPLQLLSMMVIIMLVAACANVAGLHLGDVNRRRQEIGVRSALGAGRLRIARQLLMECMARATIGALLAIAAAKAAIAFLVSGAPVDVYGIQNVSLHPAILPVAIVCGLFAGIAAGAPPALHWIRSGEAGASASGERTTNGPMSSRLRHALVIGQVALAGVLLVAAGLTTRSFARLASVDVGFDQQGLLTLEYRLPANRYGSPEAQTRFHERVLDRIRSLPGVTSAAGVRALPFSGNASSGDVRLSGSTASMRASFNAVSDDYFSTMRVPVIAGRVFEPTEATDPIVVVSHTFAEHAWPAESALGKRVYFDGVGITATVVGVVGDVHHRDLADADSGTIYAFQAQNPALFNTLAVRTTGPPMALADDVRRAVWSVDPDQPVWKIRTLESLVDRSIATRRFLLQLVAFFGISAAALALLGLYAVVTASVAQRTREIGVRVVLGAAHGRILGLVLWSGLRLAAVGILLGLSLALVAANAMRSFLFEISARDPLTFGATAVVLCAAALIACWIPAARALRVDPANALRQT